MDRPLTEEQHIELQKRLSLPKMKSREHYFLASKFVVEPMPKANEYYVSYINLCDIMERARALHNMEGLANFHNPAINIIYRKLDSMRVNSVIKRSKDNGLVVNPDWDTETYRKIVETI